MSQTGKRLSFVLNVVLEASLSFAFTLAQQSSQSEYNTKFYILFFVSYMCVINSLIIKTRSKC